MTTMRHVRELALSLPETTEQPHHDISSFRVRNKIFATVPDDGHVRIFLLDHEVTAACAEAPDGCEPLYWGTKLRGIVVTVRSTPAPLIAELLAEAWHAKAPPRSGSLLADWARCTTQDLAP
jgi:hypothetical protein